jgi:hypothetical protein
LGKRFRFSEKQKGKSYFFAENGGVFGPDFSLLDNFPKRSHHSTLDHALFSKRDRENRCF